MKQNMLAEKKDQLIKENEGLLIDKCITVPTYR
jgi:hypothetical protein